MKKAPNFAASFAFVSALVVVALIAVYFAFLALFAPERHIAPPDLQTPSQLQASPQSAL